MEWTWLIIIGVFILLLVYFTIIVKLIEPFRKKKNRKI